jgi:hypothetical protein
LFAQLVIDRSPECTYLVHIPSGLQLRQPWNAPLVRSNLHITERQRERLRQLGEDTGLCQAELIRRAIDEYLSRQLAHDGVMTEARRD